MTQLKKSIQFETAFSAYAAGEVLGEGGAGRVYGGTAADGSPVAIKLLAQDRASTEKRRRFKNEIAFLERNRHRNIVTVLDYGLLTGAPASGPFYVMRRFDCSLRDLMRTGIAPSMVMPYFSQLVDGVEAAHLQGVVHRDLKPENVLFDKASNTLAIADFGIARFTEELLATRVETAPASRLANFQYAAPEQRAPGQQVGVACDMFALGLMINEMFTGSIPQGTEYKLIASVSADYAFLDQIVSQLIRQNPAERIGSIAELKGKIQQFHSEAVSMQRLRALDNEVVPDTAIDDPSAFTAPKIVSVDWDGQMLTLTLDRVVSRDWVAALHNMGNYSSVMGYAPTSFRFSGNKAMVNVSDHAVQAVVDHFKNWLPNATSLLKQNLEQAAKRADAERRQALQRQREVEESRLRVLKSIKL